MNKHLLQVEFRFQSIPTTDYGSEYDSKVVTIGIYDTLVEAVNEGNKVIDKINAMANKTMDKIKEKLSTKGYIPTTIATNYGRRNKVNVFVTITKLYFDDLDNTIDEVIKSQNKYNKWSNHH